MRWISRLFILIFLVFLLASWRTQPAQAASSIAPETMTASPLPLLPNATTIFMTGRVTQVVETGQHDVSGTSQPFQILKIRITNGPEAGQDLEIHYGENYTIQTSDELKTGDSVVLSKESLPNKFVYTIEDHYRLPVLGWLGIVFLFLVLLFGRWRGFTSILGLGLTVLILLNYLVPKIANGGNPFTISLISALLITIFSLYLAHGLNQRTTLAVTSSILTLGLAALLASLVSHWANLSGSGDESAFFLQAGIGGLDLGRILLGGIILGVVGVLDDSTTAQSATVEELFLADRRVSLTELYRRGLSVGREHIASLVNTLFLAYVGASFATFLALSTSNTQPFWVNLNSEFLAEELVRILIGSIALVVAVPLTTFLAATVLTRQEKRKQIHD